MSPRRAAARGSPAGGVRPHGTRPPVVGALLIVAAALAGGCGFHLQGRVPLPDPVKTPYLEAPDRQSEFVQSLRRALLSGGARLAREKDQASAVVSIVRDSVTRRVLSVSGTNQRSEERRVGKGGRTGGRRGTE